MREPLQRFAAFFKRSGHDLNLDAEMKSHLTFAIDENIAAGMTPVEAHRQAMIRFGGFEAARSCTAKTCSLPFLEYWAQDLRNALRMIIALGIGASTTVFSVLRTVLVRPLSFRNPASLVLLDNSKPEEGLSSQATQVLPFMPERFDFGAVFALALTWICTSPSPLTPETDNRGELHYERIKAPRRNPRARRQHPVP